MNEEVKVKRWERWVIRLVAFYLIVLLIVALLAFVAQRLFEPVGVVVV